MKIKRSLPLVCRSWYASANPMLYRDIALRSVGQVAALLETLQSAPTLASLITNLTFACYVAEHHEEAYANDAALLLQLCQAVRSMSFIATNAPLSLPQLLPLLNPACPPLPHLTQLHLNEGFDSEYHSSRISRRLGTIILPRTITEIGKLIEERFGVKPAFQPMIAPVVRKRTAAAATANE